MYFYDPMKSFLDNFLILLDQNSILWPLFCVSCGGQSRSYGLRVFSKGEGGELLGKELANNEIDCLLNSCLDGGAKWWGLGILVLEPRKCISLAVVGIYCGEKGGHGGIFGMPLSWLDG